MRGRKEEYVGFERCCSTQRRGERRGSAEKQKEGRRTIGDRVPLAPIKGTWASDMVSSVVWSRGLVVAGRAEESEADGERRRVQADPRRFCRCQS